MRFGFAKAITMHAQEVRQILRINRDLLFLGHEDFLHRLAGEVGDFTLKITHARFTGVAADDFHQRGIVNRPFLGDQTMLDDGSRNEMLFRNFQLFIFGVTGQTNDLHPVHQRARDVQCIGRGHKHHAGEVIIHFEVMIIEGSVLLRIQHFQQCR